MSDGSSYRSARGALPPRRDAASSDPARHAVSDPLAELARLIGQDEAFGAIVRNSTRAEPRPEPQRQPEPSPSSWRSRSQPAGLQTHQAPAETHDQHAYGYDEQTHLSTAYDPHPYDEQPAAAQADAGAHHVAQATGHHGHDTGGEYYGEGADAHEAQEGHYEGEEEYADPVPERRRGAIVMVAAVAGLALVGTAGAFGYWAWSTGPRSEPPLIKADTTPNKVVPATQGEAAGNKSVYDRYADKGGTSERVVSREEAPADVKPAAPRSVYPPTGAVYGPPSAQPAAPAPSGVSANGEPRKVHTEVIRPNPNQMAAAEIGQPGQPVAPPLTVAAPPPSPPPAPSAPAKQPAPRTKQAAQPPAAQPTDSPPAREAAPTGGFVVQLSSQKTEEEARASFKVLAQKYASVFGDREPYIKRVNVPDKGTFYRANVGPFATQAEANHFCSNLKIVGGQCFVQKN
jgi:SPOR domain